MIPSTMDNTTDEGSNFVTRYIIKTCKKKLPPRLKRLMYVSSILGMMQQAKDPNMELVGKLNDVFKIAKYPEAFKFPMYIKSMIWKNMESDKVVVSNGRSIAISDLIKTDLTNNDVALVGAYFAKNVPNWLKYGSIDLLIDDVMVLLKQVKRLGDTSTVTA